MDHFSVSPRHRARIDSAVPLLLLDWHKVFSPERIASDNFVVDARRALRVNLL